MVANQQASRKEARLKLTKAISKDQTKSLHVMIEQGLLRLGITRLDLKELQRDHPGHTASAMRVLRGRSGVEELMEQVLNRGNTMLTTRTWLEQPNTFPQFSSWLTNRLLYDVYRNNTHTGRH